MSVGENHHGMIARRFTERFVPDDRPLLDVKPRVFMAGS
jgi:hypothetical protein